MFLVAVKKIPVDIKFRGIIYDAARKCDRTKEKLIQASADVVHRFSKYSEMVQQGFHADVPTRIVSLNDVEALHAQYAAERDALVGMLFMAGGQALVDSYRAEIVKGDV